MDFRSLIPFGRGSSLSRPGDDPFSAMRREMDRLFDDFSRGFPSLGSFGNGFLSPKVDVAETDKGLEITAELPGIAEKDITLDLADGLLTLKAEHKAESQKKDEKKQYHVIERSQGTFLRQFAVPFETDAAKAEAKFEKGVLHIFVPRTGPLAKPANRIAIKGSGGAQTV